MSNVSSFCEDLSYGEIDAIKYYCAMTGHKALHDDAIFYRLNVPDLGYFLIYRMNTDKYKNSPYILFKKLIDPDIKLDFIESFKVNYNKKEHPIDRDECVLCGNKVNTIESHLVNRAWHKKFVKAFEYDITPGLGTINSFERNVMFNKLGINSNMSFGFNTKGVISLNIGLCGTCDTRIFENKDSALNDGPVAFYDRIKKLSVYSYNKFLPKTEFIKLNRFVYEIMNCYHLFDITNGINKYKWVERFHFVNQEDKSKIKELFKSEIFTTYISYKNVFINRYEQIVNEIKTCLNTNKDVGYYTAILELNTYIEGFFISDIKLENFKVFFLKIPIFNNKNILFCIFIEEYGTMPSAPYYTYNSSKKQVIDLWYKSLITSDIIGLLKISEHTDNIYKYKAEALSPNLKLENLFISKEGLYNFTDVRVILKKNGILRSKKHFNDSITGLLYFVNKKVTCYRLQNEKTSDYIFKLNKSHAAIRLVGIENKTDVYNTIKTNMEAIEKTLLKIDYFLKNKGSKLFHKALLILTNVVNDSPIYDTYRQALDTFKYLNVSTSINVVRVLNELGVLPYHKRSIIHDIQNMYALSDNELELILGLILNRYMYIDRTYISFIDARQVIKDVYNNLNIKVLNYKIENKEDHITLISSNLKSNRSKRLNAWGSFILFNC